MIDTVVFTLNQDQFKILDYDSFTPSARGLFESPFYKLGKSGQRTWMRLKKEIENYPLTQVLNIEIYKQIWQSLVEFSPVIIHDHEHIYESPISYSRISRSK